MHADKHRWEQMFYLCVSVCICGHRLWRGLFPVTGFDQLADLAADQVALEGADVGNIETAVEMIDLMHECASEKLFAGLLERLALGILRPDGYLHRARHLFAEAGQAQAAFLALLHALLVNNLRV